MSSGCEQSLNLFCTVFLLRRSSVSALVKYLGGLFAQDLYGEHKQITNKQKTKQQNNNNKSLGVGLGYANTFGHILYECGLCKSYLSHG